MVLTSFPGTGNCFSGIASYYQAGRVLLRRDAASFLRDVPFFFEKYRKDVCSESEIFNLALPECRQSEQCEKALGAAQGVPVL